MNAPAWLLVIRWLIWDTFRQSLSSGIYWLMLGVSAICIVFCLSTSVVRLPAKPTDATPERITKTEAGKIAPHMIDADVIDGEMTFLFGAVRVPYSKYREDAVRWLQMVMAGFVADTLGLLLALIWTAAFLPTFLEPSSVSVLLAKPVPRWSLLAGKYIGVLVFVGFQAFVFVFGTWVALAVRTGDWSPYYLWCIPLLVLHFGIFFSFSCMLAVWTRSTIVCVFGSLLFWALCLGLNYGRHAALATPALVGNARAAALATSAVGMAGSGGVTQGMVAAAVAGAEEKDLPATGQVSGRLSGALEVAYWILPKPIDMGIILQHLVGASEYVGGNQEYEALERRGLLMPELSLLASCLFAAVMLAIAGYEFVKAEY